MMRHFVRCESFMTSRKISNVCEAVCKRCVSLCNVHSNNSTTSNANSHIWLQRRFCCCSCKSSMTSTHCENGVNNTILNASGSSNSNTSNSIARIDDQHSMNNESNNNSSTSLIPGLKSPSSIPVYLKPSRSALRRPSFYIPRLRDAAPESYAFQVDGLGTALPLFSISASSCDYFSVRIPLIKAGFKRVPMEHVAIKCNLVWGRSAFHSLEVRQRIAQNKQAKQHINTETNTTIDEQDQLFLQCNNSDHGIYETFNHFPQSHRYLGCKRGLAQELRNVIHNNNNKIAYSHLPLSVKNDLVTMYQFSPKTWFYPEEKAEIFTMMSRSSPDSWFIWKPARGSCGRGIQLTQGGSAHSTEWIKLAKEIDFRAANAPNHKLYSSYVVQEYIANPLLLQGRKMDLRLYVAVTSFDPLIVYWHEEGLVRLAAEEYKEEEQNHINNIDDNNNDVASNAKMQEEEGNVAVANNKPVYMNFSKEDSNDANSHVNDNSNMIINSHNKNNNESQRGTTMSFNVYRHLTNYSVGRTYNAASTNTPSEMCNECNSISDENLNEHYDNNDEDDNNRSDNCNNVNSEHNSSLVHDKSSRNSSGSSKYKAICKGSSNSCEWFCNNNSSSATNATEKQLPSVEKENLTSSEGTWLKWSLEKLWMYLDHDYETTHTVAYNNNNNNNNNEESCILGKSKIYDNNNVNIDSNSSSNDAMNKSVSVTKPSLSEYVKEQIGLLIIRTLMAVKPKIEKANNNKNYGAENKFFELYGFDVMLDDALQPHLIEVNVLPSLASTSSFDYLTKTNVVSDMLNLAMLEPFARSEEVMSKYTSNTNATTFPSTEVLKYVRHNNKNESRYLTEYTTFSDNNNNNSYSGKSNESTTQIVSCDGMTRRKLTLSPFIAQELQWQLQDEIDYSRGFKLLYPPVNSAMLPSLKQDISIFSQLGLLTLKDECLLNM